MSEEIYVNITSVKTKKKAFSSVYVRKSIGAHNRKGPLACKSYCEAEAEGFRHPSTILICFG